MAKRLLTLVLLVCLAALTACTSTENTAPGGDILAPLPTDSGQAAAVENLPTLTELIASDPDLVFFANGLNTVGLTDDLQNDGPFTVFAMSNVAFSTTGIIVSQVDPALLGSIIDNHVVSGELAQADLLAAGSVVSLAGGSLPIRETEDGMQVWYAPLRGEGRPASNGMLYVIDTMLLPPESGPEMSMWGVLQADGRFTTFLSAIEGTSQMGNLRFSEAIDAVLAPTDEAFATMPADVVALLESDPFAMEFVVNFHLLSPDGWPQDADLTTADMAEMGEISTRVAVGGSGFGFGFEKLPVTTTDEGLRIGDALVITPDMDATNGSVHAIDTVLIPESLLEHTNQ
ncbi:MAG: fasciclin domain-containing protein [Anaerolineae bacterium]|nr:fasciclin domain-containing protein [Anaerolineae bacterium]